MFTDLKVKIQDFFIKNKKKIIIIIVIWLIIMGINKIIGVVKDMQPPETSYEPKSPIISGSNVSKSTYTKTEDVINNYVKFCNNKEYESAYELITDDCKEIKFKNNIENFKKYVDYIFDGYKVASIQNYSNKDKVYVYKVTISEDIMATGRNNENYNTYNEMIVAYKDDTTKISLGGFIQKEKLDYMNQDSYLRVWLEEKYTYYDKVVYKIKLKNLNVYPIVIANQTETGEVILSLQGDNRSMIVDSYANNTIALFPDGEKEYEISFYKYFDESRKETSITLNKIRVLKEYSEIEEKWEEELANAIKLYSMEIPIQ